MQLKVRPEPRLPSLQVCRAPHANTQLSARAVPAPRLPFSLASSMPPRHSAEKRCSDQLSPGLFLCRGCLLCSLASSTPPRRSAQKPCSDDDTHHPSPHPPAACNTPYNSLMLVMVLGLLLRLGNSH